MACYYDGVKVSGDRTTPTSPSLLRANAESRRAINDHYTIISTQYQPETQFVSPQDVLYLPVVSLQTLGDLLSCADIRDALSTTGLKEVLVELDPSLSTLWIVEMRNATELETLIPGERQPKYLRSVARNAGRQEARPAATLWTIGHVVLGLGGYKSILTINHDNYDSGMTTMDKEWLWSKLSVKTWSSPLPAMFHRDLFKKEDIPEVKHIFSERF